MRLDAGVVHGYLAEFTHDLVLRGRPGLGKKPTVRLDGNTPRGYWEANHGLLLSHPPSFFELAIARLGNPFSTTRIVEDHASPVSLKSILGGTVVRTPDKLCRIGFSRCSPTSYHARNLNRNSTDSSRCCLHMHMAESTRWTQRYRVKGPKANVC